MLPTDLVGTDGPHRKAGMGARTDQSATEAFADVAHAQVRPLLARTGERWGRMRPTRWTPLSAARSGRGPRGWWAATA